MAILFLPLLFIIIILSGLPGNSSVKTFQYLTRPYGGSITIPCFYEHKQKDHAKYWCNTKSCIVLNRNETERRLGRVRITNNPDKLAFYITMSNLQKTDTGNYWCAVKMNGTTESSENLYLAVTDAKSVRTESWVSVGRGGSVTIPCYYDQKYKDHVKYWCRGSNWISCSILARSDSPQMTGKVSVSDDPAHLVFSVTMRNLQDEDADIYWCAIWIDRAVDRMIFLPMKISIGNVKNITGKELPAGPPTAPSGVSPKEASSADSTESSSSRLVLLLTLGLLLFLLLVTLLATVMVAVRNRQAKRPASNDDAQNRLTNRPSVDPKDTMIYSTITLQNQEESSLPKHDEELASKDPAGFIVYSTLVLKQT